MKTKIKKLATLTPEENSAWENAFAFYAEAPEIKADELAWRDVQKQFPRLKKYDGAKP